MWNAEIKGIAKGLADLNKSNNRKVKASDEED